MFVTFSWMTSSILITKARKSDVELRTTVAIAMTLMTMATAMTERYCANFQCINITLNMTVDICAPCMTVSFLTLTLVTMLST